jgi:hypothetical protein
MGVWNQQATVSVPSPQQPAKSKLAVNMAKNGL